MIPIFVIRSNWYPILYSWSFGNHWTRSCKNRIHGLTGATAVTIATTPCRSRRPLSSAVDAASLAPSAVVVCIHWTAGIRGVRVCVRTKTGLTG